MYEAEFPKLVEQQCPHDDWWVNPSDRIGDGRCTKCGERVGLSTLINNWKARLEREVRELR